jgi:hypothetical protein
MAGRYAGGVDPHWACLPALWVTSRLDVIMVVTILLVVLMQTSHGSGDLTVNVIVATAAAVEMYRSLALHRHIRRPKSRRGWSE